ncbi:MAG: transporter substrate-binding domain-containing protein [Nitrospirae bacterium]|nr:transporter substrate-binding domain-containing protein [Nitrospirota bacterium]
MRISGYIHSDLLPARRLYGALLCLLIVCLSLSFTVASQAAAEEKAGKRSVKTIVVDDYYPYTFVNEQGQPDGYSVDLIRAVVRSLGMEIDIRAGSWESARRALSQGEIDLLPMMAYSEERARSFEFSVPHTVAHDALFFQKGQRRPEGLQDLKDKRVLVMKYDAAYDYLRSQAIIPEANLVTAENLPEALRSLALGKGDVALMPKLVGLLHMKRLDLNNLDASPVGIEDYERPFSIAVRKGNAGLLSHLSEGLSVVRATGEYDRIYKKWFGFAEARTDTLNRVLKYILVVMTVFLGLTIAAFVWTLSLKKQVRLRTKELEQEVAERRKTEEALRRSEEKYRNLFDSTVDGVYQVDALGRFTHINRAGARIFGHANPEEMIGNEVVQYWRDPAAREPYIAELKDRKSVSAYHLQGKKKDGEPIELESSSRVIEDSSGNYLGLNGILRDVTERMRYEAEREKLVLELKEALAEVRTLSGMLPICASCKKIRDDKGYWSQIEDYITKHSGAFFSHGICPDCFDKQIRDLEKMRKRE